MEDLLLGLPRSLEICRDSCGTRSIGLHLLLAPSRGQRWAVTLIPAPRQWQKPEVAAQVERADFAGSRLQRLGCYVDGRPVEEHLFGSA